MEFTSYIPMTVQEARTRCQTFLAKKEETRNENNRRHSQQIADERNGKWWRRLFRLKEWTAEDARYAKDSFGLPLIWPFRSRVEEEVQCFLKALNGRKAEDTVYVSHRLAARI